MYSNNEAKVTPAIHAPNIFQLHSEEIPVYLHKFIEFVVLNKNYEATTINIITCLQRDNKNCYC